jgi:tetratricopeptide (TPR) repeat protein
MASRLVRKGMQGQGLTVWESSAKAHDPDAVPSQLLLQIALCHYTAGDLERAMKALTDAKEGAPLSADIRYYMGLCEFGWRDYIEAADRFREATELGLQNPLRVEAEYYRGLSHYHLEEYDEALEPLARAEQAGMMGSPLPFYQGLCLLGKEAPQQALPYFQEALSRGPSSEDHFHVLFYIAHTYKEMEDFGSALDYCKKAERIQPRNYELWNLKGFCYFKKRDHDAAIACFEKAIAIDPGSAIDYANIGSNLRDKGDTEGAIAMYQKALSLDPTIEFARDSLKRLLEAGKGR